jgi:hypothetical protein
VNVDPLGYKFIAAAAAAAELKKRKEMSDT